VFGIKNIADNLEGSLGFIVSLTFSKISSADVCVPEAGQYKGLEN
jgi:hypothetical protein